MATELRPIFNYLFNMSEEGSCNMSQYNQNSIFCTEQPESCKHYTQDLVKNQM